MQLSCSKGGEKRMSTPKPFTMRVSDEDIADLRARLGRTRFPDQAPDRPWAYGADLEYLRGLVSYWRDRFDWRAQEAKLNAFPQFMVPLHGIDLHYLHVPGQGPESTAFAADARVAGIVFEFVYVPRNPRYLSFQQRITG
jgi:Epoxide hydrolase N terminus